MTDHVTLGGHVTQDGRLCIIQYLNSDFCIDLSYEHGSVHLSNNRGHEKVDNKPSTTDL